MGSFKHPRAFQPLDMRPLGRRERGLTLRKLIMDSTETGRVDFDILCDRLIDNMPKHWIVSTQPRSAQDARGPNDAGAS
jgi:hypothetical protein